MNEIKKGSENAKKARFYLFLNALTYLKMEHTFLQN